ncbi:hypothetical protein CVT26_004455 [Gymnopilus dilepis]|uniref:Uncharacterized protein n=1 Tax=Gymnopilus dilepis TaxID=231916 RepID=A0A409W6W3_9AGAR|nr:hypothetical protein CVT26_004455 [Gymnopilus dilepis]
MRPRARLETSRLQRSVTTSSPQSQRHQTPLLRRQRPRGHGLSFSPPTISRDIVGLSCSKDRIAGLRLIPSPPADIPPTFFDTFLQGSLDMAHLHLSVAKAGEFPLEEKASEAGQGEWALTEEELGVT